MANLYHLLVSVTILCGAHRVCRGLNFCNFTMENVTNTEKTITVGGTIIVKCAEPSAYVIADEKAYDALNVSCEQEGVEEPKLNHRELKCERATCGNLIISNGKTVGVQIRPEVGFVINEDAMVVCDDGYDTKVVGRNAIKCMQDNDIIGNNFLLKWNATIPKCSEKQNCSHKHLILPCGGDRLIFTDTNGTTTFDIQLNMYEHGTKVQVECHKNCPGCSTNDHPTGVLECRFGKWQGDLDECRCINSKGIKARCMHAPLRRGWPNATVQWRRYQNWAQCCHICSLANRDEADLAQRCHAFNMKLTEFGVECQFFHQVDPNPVFDSDVHYFKSIADCGELVVENGVNVAAGKRHNTVVGIACDAGLTTYYTSALCSDGAFVPSRVQCANYSSIVAPNARWAVKKHGYWFQAIAINKPRSWDVAADVCGSHKGIPATALSKHLMLKIQSCVPGLSFNAWNVSIMIGLKRKSNQPQPDIGWQWIDRSNAKVIDIDSNTTVRPFWLNGKPNGDEKNRYGVIHNTVEGLYGVNNLVNANNKKYRYVLCQIGYPYYEFTPEHLGFRMTFPHESTVVDVSYDKCSESCIQNSFCRAFSYSVVLGDCRHHSIPADDPEAVIVSDANYNIYA